MNLLLIMPNFFDYPQIIEQELNEMGYEVDFFDDRPSTNGWIKAVIRINRNLIRRYIQNYFDIMIKTIARKKYDVVLLISGQSLSLGEGMIETIKSLQKQARFVLYQWDSLSNFPYIERMQKYFDKCYSFDKDDVSNNKNLSFLPLFYCKRYEDVGRLTPSSFQYDICFVGTAHPQKYKFIKMISDQLRNVFPEQYIYFFYPSRIVFFYRKLKNIELRKANYKEFHFTALNGKEMDRLYTNSKCVLDAAQEGQVGLTIRVFEALGAKKKIITTNADIRNYDFYQEENIYVYDENKINYKSPFFSQPYMDIGTDIYEKYSLKSWLKTILEFG